MKLKFLFAVMFAYAALIYAEKPVLTEGMPSLLYSLPKTRLCFDVEFERVVKTPGQFYLYSQRYLATDKVIQNEESYFSFKGIQLSAEAVPDTARTFVVSPIPAGTEGLVKLTEEGILQGINLNVSVVNKKVIKKIKNSDESFKLNSTDLLPLTEEYMLASSEAKMAEGAAKQIYHIREARLSLLTGELENMPADGESLKLMLKGLDQAEAELTSLFVGKTIREKVVKHICYVPGKPVADEVLFRFSEKRGVVEPTDLSGEPFYLTVQADTMATVLPDPKAKLQVSNFYSIIPVKGIVTVGNGIQKIIQQEIDFPQFGELNPLPQYLFKNKNLSVELDVRTGKIVRITH